jgi:hypothetical protein
LTPAPDSCAIFCCARIDHLGVVVGANGATHIRNNSCHIPKKAGKGQIYTPPPQVLLRECE